VTRAAQTEAILVLGGAMMAVLVLGSELGRVGRDWGVSAIEGSVGGRGVKARFETGRGEVRWWSSGERVVVLDKELDGGK
jgi:hypothetical protein